MPNTYSWGITQLECYPSHEDKQDVVFNIHWRRQAADGKGHIADTYGTQEVTFNPASSFTPFNSLTKEQVTAWLHDAIGAKQIAELDATLDRQIQEMIAPPVVALPAPWN
jgi:hypothetical protein